jgi:hypothetical protein
MQVSFVYAKFVIIKISIKHSNHTYKAVVSSARLIFYWMDGWMYVC